MSVFLDWRRRMGRSRWATLLGRSLVPLDRFLGRVTRGRLAAVTLPELPSMLITTTGRHSGRPRTNPLLYAADGDAYVVIGSNWGKRQHPAWSTNLLANPEAVATVGGERIRVRARLATGAERERLLDLLRAIWPAYDAYAVRAEGRRLRVFRLERV